MNFYPPHISAKFHSPKNVGQAADANAEGTNATFVCGAVLRLTLRIDRETKTILEAKYKTNGCGFLIAAAETLAEKISGRRLTEPHKFDGRDLESEIEGQLGHFGECRRHCLELSLNTLQAALANFRSLQIEEFIGETALVCTCFGVTEQTIENLIEKKALGTVEDVTDVCRAGGGCGSCQPLIQEIIDAVRRDEI